MNSSVLVDDLTKLEKAGSETKQSAWGKLQDDLLIEIKNRLLLYSDQVRFHAVCKNWFASNKYSPIPLLPWLIKIIYYQHRFTCQLFEPSCSSNLTNPTFVYTVNLTKYDVSIHKYGWIFCTPTDQWSDHIHFLLFSPFTNDTIKLPPTFWGKPFRSTFSIHPNSPDCVFLLLYDNATQGRITIKTFCHGYKNWSSREFSRPENFEGCSQFPVYIRGIFYFVFPGGKLASYNVDHHKWKFENVMRNKSFPKIFLHFCFYEAFELNEELMLIYIVDQKDPGFVARFDWSKKAWVPLESLGNYSLFCTRKSILVSPIGNEERNRGVLPNKIYDGRSEYFFYSKNESKCTVYSLESGKLARFMDRSGIRSWDERDTDYKGHWFEPPHSVQKKLPQNFSTKNNPKKSVILVLPKQCPNGTDTDVINELGNREMDQTGKQSIDEKKDDEELGSLIILDQMRRSRNAATGNNTAEIKLYDTGKKGILKRTSKH